MQIVILKSNFYGEAVKGRGFWLYVEVVQSLYFWGEKVSSLRIFTQKGYRPLKFWQKWKNLEKNQKGMSEARTHVCLDTSMTP